MAGVKGKSGGSRANTGGARPGAGRPPKNPKLVIDSDGDPKKFLTALMEHDEVDLRLRAEAAKALLSAEKAASKNSGKKGAKQEAAEATTGGRFGLRAVG